MLSFSRSCPKYSQLYAQNLKNHELKPEEAKNKVSESYNVSFEWWFNKTGKV